MMEILDTMKDGRVATRRGRKAAASAAQNAGDSSDVSTLSLNTTFFEIYCFWYFRTNK